MKRGEVGPASEVCRGKYVKKEQKTSREDINPPIKHICSKNIKMESNI